MRTSTALMIVFATLFGLLAVFAARSWINNQAEARLRSREAETGAGGADHRRGAIVLPGDRVDIALTRLEGKDNGATEWCYRTLGVCIDQLADNRSAAPSVAKSVTLEVAPVAAKELTLAAPLGNLSLQLRKGGGTISSTTPMVSFKDLFHDILPDMHPNWGVVTIRRGT